MCPRTLTSPWLVVTRPNALARARLFCFPYAGGAASIFRPWGDALPSHVEVCAVQLPGRGNRLRETPIAGLPQLVAAAAEALLPFFDRPFAFFGHSMGALISFELARRLASEGQTLPRQLFVSAHPAPHLPETDPPTYNLPDDEFIEELRRIDGTPAEVLDNPELMQLMLPLLRADFSVYQTYAYTPAPPLACPITAFGGMADHSVTREHLEGWRQHTAASFALRMFPGDHFFLHTSQTSLLRTLAQELESLRV